MDYLIKDFGKLLKKNHLERRHDLGSSTDCMRVYDRNQASIPVTVDLYGKYARLTDFSEEGLSDDLIGELKAACVSNLYLQPSDIIVTRRKKRTEGEQHEKTELEPVLTTVSENGLFFDVNLTSYTDTGLFLDQVLARQFIREQSAGTDVLNLFSYTGSFSVYAAAGGANSVTSVDLSSTYTSWAEKNLEKNGFSGSPFKCISQDASVFVRNAIEEGRKYSIIIFDPPSFSNSHKMEKDFDVSRDFSRWIHDLEKLLTRDGFIYFSTNYSLFELKGLDGVELKVANVTDIFRAPGFSAKNRGAVRSWIMAKEENNLSLNWKEPEKKSRRPQGHYDRKDRYEGSDKVRSRRKPEKQFGLNEYKGASERMRAARERNNFSEERPYRGYRDRSDDRRDFEKREYERRDYVRRERHDDSRYDSYRSDARRRDDYHPGHRFNDDRERGDRERRDMERRPSYRSEYSDRPERPRYERSDRSERPERPRYDRSSRPSGPSHSSHSSRRPSDSRSQSQKREKPYGYESFRPARSREDDSRFFWNDED